MKQSSALQLLSLNPRVNQIHSRQFKSSCIILVRLRSLSAMKDVPVCHIPRTGTDPYVTLQSTRTDAIHT